MYELFDKINSETVVRFGLFNKVISFSLFLFFFCLTKNNNQN